MSRARGVAREALRAAETDREAHELERIHQFAGLPFGAAQREAAECARTKNVQHKYGRHGYALSDFGLSDAMIRSELGAYCDRYEIPREDGTDHRLETGE